MKANIQVAAVNKKTHVDLSTATLTTLNWFNMKPIYFKEVLPDEEVDIDISGQLQMLALNKPMFSNIRCLTRSFFVPYRTVFSHWNAFITDTREKNKKYTVVPNLNVYDFLNAFRQDTDLATDKSLIEGLGNAGTQNVTDTFDFIVRDGFPGTNNSTVYETHGYNFTKAGRRVYDILVGLGYNFNFGYTNDPSSFITNLTDATKFGNVSLLNLMCYGKIVADWFTLPAYQDKINTIGAILDTLAEGAAAPSVVVSNVIMLLKLCIDLHYMDDIFVSAWDNPVSPNDSVANTNIFIKDMTNNASESNSNSVSYTANYSVGTGVYKPNNGTPYIGSAGDGGSTNQPKNVTQYILNALQKLSSFLRRNQIVGYRPLDRYLARYNKKLNSEQLIRSIVLGEDKFNVEINPVLSTADTVGMAANQQYGSQLGDKSGQGFGTLNGHLHFNPQEEFGVIIIVAYVLPSVKYYQGLNPANMRLTLTDFYQPEFDGLGCEAIPAKTLFSASMNSKMNYTGYGGSNPYVVSSRYPLNEVFGFAPRYYTYKTNPYATVSGDFRFNSRNVGMEQWHLFRQIYSNPLPNIQPQALNLETYNWKHNQRFTEGSSDDEYYNRIFQLDDGENDGFILGFNFNVDSALPVKPLYDDYILNSDPDSEHQERREFTVSGTRLQ